MQLLPSIPTFENSEWNVETWGMGKSRRWSCQCWRQEVRILQASSGVSEGKVYLPSLISGKVNLPSLIPGKVNLPSLHTQRFIPKKEIDQRQTGMSGGLLTSLFLSPYPSSSQNLQHTSFLHTPSKHLLIAGCMYLMLGVQFGIWRALAFAK